jgi:hypothetical protein
MGNAFVIDGDNLGGLLLDDEDAWDGSEEVFESTLRFSSPIDPSDGGGGGGGGRRGAAVSGDGAVAGPASGVVDDTDVVTVDGAAAVDFIDDTIPVAAVH